MPDDKSAPQAVPMLHNLAMLQPSDEQLVRERERRHITNMLQDHDAARAAAPKVTLVCVTPFTIVDDDNPNGRLINRGDEFEISEFDLPRYLGRGLFKGQYFRQG